MQCYGTEDHDSITPHLLHSINVTQVDMELIDLDSNKTFHALRVAAEFVMVASEAPTNDFNIKERRTVDDEHTPGTFRLVDIVSPDGENGTQGKSSIALTF